MEPTGIEREPECRKSPVKYFNKSAFGILIYYNK